MNTHIKVSLLIACMSSNNQGKVAQLIGVESFKVLSMPTQENFYCNLGSVMEQATCKRCHYEAFHCSMDMVMQHMENDVCNDNGDVVVVVDNSSTFSQPSLAVPKIPILSWSSS